MGESTKTKLPSFNRSNEPVFKDTAHEPVTDQMKKSLTHLMLSQELLKLGKLREAIRSLERAIRYYSDPGYEYILGILYLRDGQAERALDTIRRTERKYRFSPLKKDILSLWEGRCLDVLGKRDEARSCYRKILTGSILVKHLKKVLKRSLRRPFSLKQMPFAFDYTFLGPLQF
jgi:tetratricopeptide (TPR) repeat protein